MRVMFAVSDFRPHYYPMVPLGWALQAAGHEVRVVCAPGQQQHIQHAGLTPVPVLRDMDPLLWARFGVHLAARSGTLPPDLGLVPLHPVTGEELASFEDFDSDAFLRTARADTAAIMGQRISSSVDFARQWRPDLVVHDLLNLDAVVPAKALGVPAVCHLTGPIGTEETEWGLDFIPTHFSREYDRYGIEERGTDLIEHVVDICPPSMAPPTRATRLQVRHVPYNGPGAVPGTAVRRGDRPRVCVMWSATVPLLYGAVAFTVPTVLEALAGLDADVVLTMSTESCKRVGPLPANVELLEQAPVHTLLSTSDVLVHNGGAGAALAAIAAGVPQLCLTFGAEYRANGQRVSATGAGRVLPGLAGARDIRATMRDLLGDPVFTERARALRDEMQSQPSPTELAEVLEEMAMG
ncbi:nucleotide disphospho-sugar-binding domain-containing protein [Streptomyces rimosus]|uniref:nucleotide disphospho-sugar-binding domain-containing protein n=1 Tax=Streptomyces rimosus TaxID=1927 RepID=UPI0004C207B2|nr:nucleotide disphospho-sugar-binding domain-containing protein [Streptomyces rimosus]